MSDSVQKILIFDYDGTLTLDESGVPEAAVDALKQIRDSRLATLGIISGRSIRFLKNENTRLSNVFSFFVAENGAISHFIDTGETMMLGRDWSEKARRVFSDVKFTLRFGEIMCATKPEYADRVTALLRESKLQAKLVYNRENLMILPPNVDKGTGVSSAMIHYGSTSKIHLTCFGDGENDVDLFSPADVGVAVSNAVDELKKIADVVTTKPGGLGVAEYLTKEFLLDQHK